MDPEFDMPPHPAPFEARGGWLVSRLAADFGMTLEQSAGLVGNLGFESVGFKTLQEMAPSVSGSRGGYGWAQWTGPRRRSFEGWCARNDLKPASDEANYGYLAVELRGDYRRTIEQVKKCATLEAAVFSVGQTYERPGGTTPTHLPGFEGRLNYARRALAGAATTISSPSNEAAKSDKALRRTLRLTDPMMNGADVVELQKQVGLLPELQDGIFGKVTEAAVKSFQQELGLKADGVVGPGTWSAIDKAA